MSAGTKKPVRWTIPDVKSAPARALRPDARDATVPATPAAYPSAAEIASSPEWRAWLDAALGQILRPAALAGAVALAASGCGTSAAADELLGGEPRTGAPVFSPTPAGAAPGYQSPATLVAAGAPYGGKPEPGGAAIGGSLPEIVPPCPLPTPTGTGTITTTPIPTPHPPAVPGGLRAFPPTTPPAVRGGAPAVHVPPPAPPTTPPRLAGRVAPTRPILPHPDPPEIEGDIAIVHPE
jgi:hypothetical protein